MNFRFPVFMDVGGKRCIVTGEGYEVPSKVESLVRAGAAVTYIHPTAADPIASLAESGALSWEKRKFESHDLNGCFLVIADTDENAEIFQMAEERGILCNCVDDPQHCRFAFGSVHRQGELTFAISTNGWAPAVAVRLRQWLEREIGPEYAALLDILKNARPKITEGVEDFNARRSLWYDIVDSNILELLQHGDAGAAERLVEAKVRAALNSTSHSHTCGDAGHQ